jgi:hypothetical protein
MLLRAPETSYPTDARPSWIDLLGIAWLPRIMVASRIIKDI